MDSLQVSNTVKDLPAIVYKQLTILYKPNLIFYGHFHLHDDI